MINAKACSSSKASSFSLMFPTGEINVMKAWNFIQITLWHGFSTVNFLHVFRTPFPQNTSERLDTNS